MATSTKRKPATSDKLWQEQIIDQLADLDPSDFTHVVYARTGETATLLEHHDNETDAITGAARLAVDTPEHDEVAVVSATELHTFIDNQTAGTNGHSNPDGNLFDADEYADPRLALDKVDDQDVDKIRVEFSGSVMLDRKDAGDVAFMRRLKLGQPLELRVAATCHSKKTGYTTGKEGDLDAIVYTGGLKVDTLYVLTPEELAA